MKYLTILFLLTALAVAQAKQVSFGIYALPNGWYSVKAESQMDFVGNPRNQIGSSQVTIKFPKGGVKLGEFTSVHMIWEAGVVVDFQKDEPDYAYLSFATLGDTMTLRAGQEVELFRFRNLEKSEITVELLDHSQDKYFLNSLTKTGNSVCNNPGNNLFQVTEGEIYESNFKPAAKQNNLSTEISEGDSSLPDSFSLEQNHPNPFNPSTVIPYRIKVNGHVQLSVYNLKGQLVRTLVSMNQDAGFHEVIWDGRDDNGNLVPSGYYIYSIKTNGFNQARKMSLLK